jgi:hypothetical protein
MRDGRRTATGVLETLRSIWLRCTGGADAAVVVMLRPG